MEKRSSKRIGGAGCRPVTLSESDRFVHAARSRASSPDIKLSLEDERLYEQGSNDIYVMVELERRVELIDSLTTLCVYLMK